MQDMMRLKDKRILIIGSSGLFGTAMEDTCAENGLNYIGVSHEELEITNKRQLERKVREVSPNIIVNAAAFMGVPQCENNAKKAFAVNAVAAMNLAKVCKEDGITLVQTSTNAIFDGEKSAPYFEADRPNPRNVYGLSKYAGELCVQNNLDSHYIMRFPKLFGGRKNGAPGFTDKMIERMRNGQELKVADDRIEPFTYTVHAARKMLSLLENEADFGIYHLANQGSVSFYDFVHKLGEQVGYKGKIKRAKDNDFPMVGYSPLRAELSSHKIVDMPTFKEAFGEYVRRGGVKL